MGRHGFKRLKLLNVVRMKSIGIRLDQTPMPRIYLHFNFKTHFVASCRLSCLVDLVHYFQVYNVNFS